MEFMQQPKPELSSDPLEGFPPAIIRPNPSEEDLKKSYQEAVERAKYMNQQIKEAELEEERMKAAPASGSPPPPHGGPWDNHFKVDINKYKTKLSEDFTNATDRSFDNNSKDKYIKEST